MNEMNEEDLPSDDVKAMLATAYSIMQTAAQTLQTITDADEVVIMVTKSVGKTDKGIQKASLLTKQGSTSPEDTILALNAMLDAFQNQVMQGDDDGDQVRH